MLRLTQTVNAWGRPDLEAVFKDELRRQAGQLPLQQGLSAGSYALDDEVEVMLIAATEDARRLHVKAGVFYNGILTGCSCADDPTPVAPQPEYCELRLDIDKASAETTVTLVR